ncbi:MAG TPA: UDP-N-acetylmuramate dehydrogenase [Streptosporangiaceae bacterium]|nr:UDP-N-acetylmuramate dehydrogenase [Streptosporangiaceae bacterium]
MNHVQCGVALSGYTTLGLGGPASRFVVAGTDDELVSQVRAADERGEPLLVLGGGSNLVISDDGFDGTVVRVATRGVVVAGDRRTLTVAAGEDWDSLVRRCVTAGLAGLECLSGIPGLTGATPIQNVGAYGQEVAETIIAVRTYDRLRREMAELTAPQCGFGYRTSMFKRDPGRHVVLGVTFGLARERLSRPVGYAELATRLGVTAGDRVPLEDARSAVLGLRRGKGMVLDPGDPDTRSAGSFFTNPVITKEQFAGVERVASGLFGDEIRVPWYPAHDGLVKVPAAWLIERAGFGKGYQSGDARISSKHTLALVNPGGGSTKGLLGLAAEIRDGVLAAFGVRLTPEPVLVGVTL